MEISRKTYCPELENSFLDKNWMQNEIYLQLHSRMRHDFKMQSEKEYFTYLLLDPRITKNLPARIRKEPFEVVWPTFIKSIFYIGKGRDIRGYSHLKEARNFQRGGNQSNPKKIQTILDIWSANHGVLILHILGDIVSDEASTYEAAMIEVIGLTHLTNIRRGTYYGEATKFTLHEKRMLGLSQLLKAFKIYICERERQIKSKNLRH